MSLDSDGLGRVVELPKRTSYPASRGSISEEAVTERLEGDDVVTMIIVVGMVVLGARMLFG